MTPADLDAYLHTHIPLSRHMGLHVILAEPGCVRVQMPLAPNLNPHGTIFGGALSALGLVTGWMLVHAAFERAGLAAKVVGQRSDSQFLAPASADCIAESTCPAAALEQLLASFRSRGRARLQLDTRIRVGALDVVHHRSTFVARQERTAA